MWAQHHRFAIYAIHQHPYKHSAADFLYGNPTLPTGVVANLQQAVDWILAVLYPQTKPAVANQAALPLIGNVLNDYRVVQDDGDGKSAGYRWEQREGEAAASWHKVLDIDWGADSVLQAWEQRTQYLWVMKGGYDDIDVAGAKLTGTDAGQHIYGGQAASSNLSLHPNSGDGAGAITGFVQVSSHFRPMTANLLDSGTAALPWRSGYFQTSLLVGSGQTTTLSKASLTDSGGAFSFGTNALTAGSLAATTSASSFKTGTTVGNLTLSNGSISDSGGSISFGANALTTTGLLTANAVTATGAVSTLKTGTTIGNLTLSNGSIVDSGGSISFGANTLSSGTITVGNSVLSSGQLTTTAGALTLNSFSGTVTVSAATLGFAAASGTSVNLGGTVFSVNGVSTAATVLTLDGSSIVVTGTDLSPTADAAETLGKTTKRFSSLYLSAGISDGTNSIAIATLLSLRAILTGVGTGYGIFYNGTQWVAADPDTEVFHDSISHLTSGGTDGDAGHSQFVVAAGRAVAQTIKGGTAASASLTLDSTAHATKGKIITASTLQAGTDATFDIGDATHRYVNLYLSGQAIGLRVENYTTVGRPGAGAAGRLYWDTTVTDLYVDNGTSWVLLSSLKYYNQDAAGWTGSVAAVTYDVSSVFSATNPAYKALWQFQDNANNRQVLQGALFSFPSATQVTVTFDNNLAAGTYTLVGVG